MASLQEILAKKKALAEQAAANMKPVEETPPPATEQLLGQKVVVEVKDEKVQAISPLDAESPAPEPEASKEPEKPLTFAEKLRLKREGIQAAQKAEPPPKPEVKIDPSMLPENPEDAQAYVDIKHKIANLSTLFEDDLSSAMSDLKAALKKNPNAAELMLDEDVGLMVIALRKLRNEDITASSTKGKKDKKPPKAKDVQLSEADIIAAFDEL